MSLRLKYLDLQNFQSYKRARIPLTDFTIVVGLSSSGKTALFRALQFLLYGEWDSTYPNDPAAATAVAIEFENGTRVLRIRRPDKENQAAIIRNGETIKYESFGSTIPGIHSLLNAQPIKIGSKPVNLNFSLQDDPTFMVSEPRPAKAQWIGRLYGAHIISQMLREMAKDKKNTEAERKSGENRLEGLLAELSMYATLEEQEAILGEAGALLEHYKTLKECGREAAVLQVELDSYNRDKWVLGADTKAIRGDLERLAALRLLRDECVSFAIAKAELKRLSRAMKIDAAIMRREVEHLSDLIVVRDGLARVKQDGHAVDESFAAMGTALANAHVELNNSAFADNKCPVCEGTLQGTVNVRKNLARLLGSKINAD